MISLTTKYALRALQSLVEVDGAGFHRVEEIAARCGVPAPYLAKIFKTLASKQLISSKKGLNGGFRLNQEGPPLTLYDVAVALDDPAVRLDCFLERSECSETHQCAYHSGWGDLRARIMAFLKDHVVWMPPLQKITGTSRAPEPKGKH